MSEIENIIDEGVNSQIRGLAVTAILGKAGDITLAKLADLRASQKYGAVMQEVSLQELIDAYVDQHKLVEASSDSFPGEPVATVVSNGPKKKSKKGTRKARNGSASASSSTKGGGGGSAAPGKKVNFRDPEEKERYAKGIEQLIRDRAGEPVSTTEATDLCGGSSNQAREVLQQLVTAGKAVWTGRARATRYYWKSKAAPEIIKQFEAESGAAA